MSDSIQNDTETTLTDRQKRAIPYLAAGPSIREGCRQAKIRTETFYQWIKNPAFETALKKQREALFKEALQTLSSSVQNAVDTLTGLIATDNESLKRAVCNDILGLKSRKGLNQLRKLYLKRRFLDREKCSKTH
jgi:hypothetical protein